MSNDEFELVRGSGNIFRDFDRPNADLKQLRAIVAAQIIGVLDDRKLSTRKAEALTSTPAADFSRIRNADIGRFTVDRLMKILAKLDQDIEVSVTVGRRSVDSESPAQSTQPSR